MIGKALEQYKLSEIFNIFEKKCKKIKEDIIIIDVSYVDSYVPKLNCKFVYKNKPFIVDIIQLKDKTLDVCFTYCKKKIKELSNEK